MNYITHFQKSRSTKIGSSDVPALIQHPEKSGSERILSLKEIKSLDGGDRLYKYMQKNGLIKIGERSRFISVKLKEGWDEKENIFEEST